MFTTHLVARGAINKVNREIRYFTSTHRDERAQSFARRNTLSAPASKRNMSGSVTSNLCSAGPHTSRLLNATVSPPWSPSERNSPLVCAARRSDTAGLPSSTCLTRASPAAGNPKNYFLVTAAPHPRPQDIHVVLTTNIRPCSVRGIFHVSTICIECQSGSTVFSTIAGGTHRPKSIRSRACLQYESCHCRCWWHSSPRHGSSVVESMPSHSGQLRSILILLFHPLHCPPLPFLLHLLIFQWALTQNVAWLPTTEATISPVTATRSFRRGRKRGGGEEEEEHEEGEGGVTGLRTLRATVSFKRDWTLDAGSPQNWAHLILRQAFQPRITLSGPGRPLIR